MTSQIYFSMDSELRSLDIRVKGERRSREPTWKLDTSFVPDILYGITTAITRSHHWEWVFIDVYFQNIHTGAHILEIVNSDSY